MGDRVRPGLTKRTIRTRITATALAVVGSALVLMTVAVLVLLQRALTENVDQQTRVRLNDVAAMAQRGEVPATLAGEDDGTVAQVVSDGRVLAQSPLIHRREPLLDLAPPDGGVVVRTVAGAPIGDDDVGYRVAATRVDTPTGPVVVYAAASLEPVVDSVEAVAIILLVAVPVVVLLVGVTVWRLVGRTLEPVESIRRQMAEISAAALDRRVPEPATSDEINRLARTMNEMLDRLESAAHRQRAFVADASHELRSPLATVRAKLEVGLAASAPGSAGAERVPAGSASGPAGAERAAAGRAPVDWPGLARECLAEQDRLERLVTDLLLLARLDEDAAAPARTVVDLDELVLREARDVRFRGRVRVDVSGVGGGRVRGDRERLHRAVRNLIDNAERHAAATIGCELRRDGESVELVVTDDGPGIPEGQRRRIFERFVRLDEARGRRDGGTGLGLAIVHDTVVAHGGTVEAAAAARGARFVVRLPAADADAP